MEPDEPLRHLKHVLRAALLLALLLVVMVLGRAGFVPDSWGEYGWYRGDAVGDYRAQERRHAGDEACGACHDEQQSVHLGGVHARVRCELCHGPLAWHVADNEVVKEMPIAESVELCSRCHRTLTARPDGFPQVNLRQHLEGFDVEMEDNVCTGCHDPHSPADL